MDKYEEALERARELYNGAASSPGRKEWLEEIFPELVESEDEVLHYEWTGSLPFGAYDSENIGLEYTIPEGMEAIIEDGKVIVRKKESEDERIRERLIEYFEGFRCGNAEIYWEGLLVDDVLCWLVKQEVNTEGDFGRGYDCGYQAGYSVAVNEMKPKVATATLASEKQEGHKDFNKLYEDIAKSEWFKKSYEGKLLGCDYEQKEQIPYIDFVIKPHKGDDNNPYDMRVYEAQEYAIKRGFGIPFNDGEVYVDERHITQTIGNILRWADEHPKEPKPGTTPDNPIDPFDTKLLQDGVKEGRRLEREEQKLAEWTDDEKDKLNRIYRLIGIAADEHAYSTTCRLIGDKEAVELQDFLRSLVKPQAAPAEWSEEDERNFYWISTTIQERHLTPEYTQQVHKILSWLKSLRPQPKQECKDCKEYEKGYQQGYQEGHTLGYNDGYKKATEEYNKYTSYHFPVMPTTPPVFGCDGIHCTNPQMDCIGCPRKTTGGFTASPNTVSIKDSIKFGNLEYERGVKDGIQHANSHQWKPSEEQITTLKKVVFNRPIGSEELDILESLYDDLNAL